jgi:glycosyltransferase involved in cell wall biosynthesis
MSKKIAFISPGDISVPPKGWGALETVVWNQAKSLQSLGYDTKIINSLDSNYVYQEIQKFNPDIVHLHYGKHYEILPHIHCKKVITNHDGSFLFSAAFHEQIIRKYMYDCTFFILTTWEKTLLQKIGFHDSHIKILPNGVDINSFRITNSPEYKDFSICVGKIDERKNQVMLQKLESDIFFVGQNTDKNFDPLDDHYLGSWSRDEIYENLTNYSNLILLSNSELQPLVCLEALAAGLGLVITEACAQNLDTTLPFITVIDSSKIQDQTYVKEKILHNRNYCNSINRENIRAYAKSFDWKNIAQTYNGYLV